MAGSEGQTELLTGWSCIVHQPSDDPEPSELYSTVDMAAFSSGITIDPGNSSQATSSADSDSDSESDTNHSKSEELSSSCSQSDTSDSESTTSSPDTSRSQSPEFSVTSSKTNDLRLTFAPVRKVLSTEEKMTTTTTSSGSVVKKPTKVAGSFSDGQQPEDSNDTSKSRTELPVKTSTPKEGKSRLVGKKTSKRLSDKECATATTTATTRRSSNRIKTTSQEGSSSSENSNQSDSHSAMLASCSLQEIRQEDLAAILPDQQECEAFGGFESRVEKNSTQTGDGSESEIELPQQALNALIQRTTAESSSESEFHQPVNPNTLCANSLLQQFVEQTQRLNSPSASTARKSDLFSFNGASGNSSTLTTSGNNTTQQEVAVVRKKRGRPKKQLNKRQQQQQLSKTVAKSMLSKSSTIYVNNPNVSPDSGIQNSPDHGFECSPIRSSSSKQSGANSPVKPGKTSEKCSSTSAESSPKKVQDTTGKSSKLAMTSDHFDRVLYGNSDRVLYPPRRKAGRPPNKSNAKVAAVKQAKPEAVENIVETSVKTHLRHRKRLENHKNKPVPESNKIKSYLNDAQPGNGRKQQQLHEICERVSRSLEMSSNSPLSHLKKSSRSSKGNKIILRTNNKINHSKSISTCVKLMHTSKKYRKQHSRCSKLKVLLKPASVASITDAKLISEIDQLIPDFISRCVISTSTNTAKENMPEVLLRGGLKKVCKKRKPSEYNDRKKKKQNLTGSAVNKETSSSNEQRLPLKKRHYHLTTNKDEESSIAANEKVVEILESGSKRKDKVVMENDSKENLVTLQQSTNSPASINNNNYDLVKSERVDHIDEAIEACINKYTSTSKSTEISPQENTVMNTVTTPKKRHRIESEHLAENISDEFEILLQDEPKSSDSSNSRKRVRNFSTIENVVSKLKLKRNLSSSFEKKDGGGLRDSGKIGRGNTRSGSTDNNGVKKRKELKLEPEERNIERDVVVQDPTGIFMPTVDLDGLLPIVEKNAKEKDKLGLQKEKLGVQKEKLGVQKDKVAVTKEKLVTAHKDKTSLQKEDLVKLCKDKSVTVEVKESLTKTELTVETKLETKPNIVLKKTKVRKRRAINRTGFPTVKKKKKKVLPVKVVTPETEKTVEIATLDPTERVPRDGEKYSTFLQRTEKINVVALEKLQEVVNLQEGKVEKEEEKKVTQDKLQEVITEVTKVEDKVTKEENKVTKEENKVVTENKLSRVDKLSKLSQENKGLKEDKLPKLDKLSKEDKSAKQDKLTKKTNELLKQSKEVKLTKQDNITKPTELTKEDKVSITQLEHKATLEDVIPPSTIVTLPDVSEDCIDMINKWEVMSECDSLPQDQRIDFDEEKSQISSTLGDNSDDEDSDDLTLEARIVKYKTQRRLKKRKNGGRAATVGNNGSREKCESVIMYKRKLRDISPASSIEPYVTGGGDKRFKETSSSGDEFKKQTKIPRWRKKYLMAGLFSDYYKENDDKSVSSSGTSSTATTCRSKLVYNAEDHPYGLLPAPYHCGKYLRCRKISFQLPYDLWWQHTHSQLPGRDIVPSWNYRKVRSNVYNVKNTSVACEPQACNCKKECEDDCINRLVLSECPPAHKCKNQRIQKHEWAPGIEKFMTEKKGWGVRTNDPIKHGEFILEYVGEVVSDHTFKERMESRYTHDTHHYCLHLDGTLVIDGHRMGGDGRFVNHSCEPNCEMQKWSVNGYYRMALFALRDIGAGEEITYDYNFSLFNAAEGQQCLCGGEQCRGVIGGKTQRVRLGQLLPAPHPPHATTGRVGRPRKIQAAKKATGEVDNSASVISKSDNLAAGATMKPLSNAQKVYVMQHHCFLMRNLKKIKRLKSRSAPNQTVISQQTTTQSSTTDQSTNYIHHLNALRLPRNMKTRTAALAEVDPELKTTLKLAEVLRELFTIITEAKDENNLRLCEPFLTVPPKKKCPEYYTRIENPIDITLIEQNIGNGVYRSADMFDTDVNRLITNVLRFSGLNSDLGILAVRLKGIYQRGKREFIAKFEKSEDNESLAKFMFSKKKGAEEDIIRCICGMFRDEGLMIQCERCLVWQHCECVKADSTAPSYHCERCVPREVDYEIPMDEYTEHGHRYYMTLMRGKLQLAQGDTVYVLRDIPIEGTDRKHTYDTIGDIPFEDLDIFRIERLWKDCKNGKRFAYGHHYLRPHETYHEPTRKFFPNEVMRVPLYEAVPVELIISHCWVLDLNTYCKGRPLAAPERHVYICENRVDKSARLFSKVARCSKFPVCTKSYAFEVFEQRLKMTRTYVPHDLSTVSVGNSTSNGTVLPVKQRGRKPLAENGGITQLSMMGISGGNLLAGGGRGRSATPSSGKEWMEDGKGGIGGKDGRFDGLSSVRGNVGQKPKLNDILLNLLSKLPTKKPVDLSYLLEGGRRKKRTTEK